MSEITKNQQDIKVIEDKLRKYPLLFDFMKSAMTLTEEQMEKLIQFARQAR